MGGFAALLVVATLALSSCGGDGAPSTSTSGAAGSTAAATVTQTATATATTGAATTAPRTTDTSSQPERTTTKATTTKAEATTPAPQTTSAPAAPDTCPPVQVGIRDGDVEATYAKITEQRKVSCQTVVIVAGEWGRERLGLDRALLPKGWDCTKQNVCTSGSSRIAFRFVKFG